MSKPKPSRHAPEEVDDYLAAQKPEFRDTLTQFREIIKRIAPHCTERVNYKISIFRLKKDFVAMSATAKHCGLHTMSKTIPKMLTDELRAAGNWTSGTTLPIKPGSELPVELQEKVLRARLAEAQVG